MSEDVKKPEEKKEAAVVVSAETVSTTETKPSNGAVAPQTPAAAPAKTEEKKPGFLARVGKWTEAPVTRKQVMIAGGVVTAVIVGTEIGARYSDSVPCLFGVLKKKAPATPGKK
jgi:hypothetical protein